MRNSNVQLMIMIVHVIVFKFRESRINIKIQNCHYPKMEFQHQVRLLSIFMFDMFTIISIWFVIPVVIVILDIAGQNDSQLQRRYNV